ncbi:DsrE family protein [Guyparkeria hydrothermalis]|uniref:DsrE family protein n=1 Tax=Guyparkeria hydrothermalis TaxID=923 RepID=UPI00201FE1D4|nr:DsrE family protein [Guyparkeria hydrothermalis]MCL7744972.1 DsrE family protein [Guyparkeria hydrothermalis]
MKTRSLFRTAALMLAAAMAFGTTAQAANQKAIEAVGGNTLAKEHLVLQITEKDPVRQNLVLNVANNVMKARGGPDQIDVEVVAFGPGISLLFEDNKQADRIESLAQQGVRFSACKNSIAGATRKMGHKPEMNAAAEPVDAGIARLLDLVDAGYVLVRP